MQSAGFTAAAGNLAPRPPRLVPHSYQVRRRADQRLYALKHIDLACVKPVERADVVADLVNEIRCGGI